MIFSKNDSFSERSKSPLPVLRITRLRFYSLSELLLKIPEKSNSQQGKQRNEEKSKTNILSHNVNQENKENMEKSMPNIDFKQLPQVKIYQCFFFIIIYIYIYHCFWKFKAKRLKC